MEDTTLLNQIENYLKEDNLTRWTYQSLYLENPLFRDDFKENEYISIIYTEGEFIRKNLSAGENIFTTRFLFRHLNLNPSQRYVIIISLKEYVNSLKFSINRSVNNFKKSIHFKPENIVQDQYKVERLGFIENLLAAEKVCINQQIKYFFNDELSLHLNDIEDVKEKINYLKKSIIEAESHENNRLYPYQYKFFVDRCKESIAKLKIDINEQIEINQLSDKKNKPLTHKEEAIFYKYKVLAKLEPELTTAEIKIKWNSKNREMAFNSLKWPNKPSYCPPKRDELINVKNAAHEYPAIVKAIENDLADLE